MRDAEGHERAESAAIGALEATGTVRSTDARTGAALEVHFDNGEPGGETTIFILGGYDPNDAVENWCPFVNFFATRHDAEVWARDQNLDGDIRSVSAVVSQAAELWHAVVRQRIT